MIDFDWNISRIWLYSGIFSGWWCYNNSHNIKINKMYKDYCHRNNVNYVDLVTEKIKNTKPKLNSNVNTEKVFDFVNFDDENDDKDKQITSNFVVDYIIRVANDTFRIDLDKMKQINVNDPQKQRNIQYVDIPEEILNNKDKIILHLKGIGAKGIAGKNF